MSSAALDQFTAIHAELQGRADDPSWLRELRVQGLERFTKLGFPTTRQEEWKYTNVGPLARIPFRSPNGIGLAAARQRDGELRLPGCAALVFVDGRYAAELSRTEGLSEGVRLRDLGAALAEDEDLVRRHFSERRADGAFDALSLALFESGAFVHVSRDTAVEQPIQLLFIDSATQERTTSQLRNLIVVEQGASCMIIESYVSLGALEQLTNVVSQLVCESGARLEHCLVQQPSESSFQLNALEVEQAAGSRFCSHLFALGGALVRNDLNVRLAGDEAECALNGLFMVDGARHVDNHSVIDHAKPLCRSEQLYKGILDESAHGVFSGKIRVHQHAQKTDARQSNKNLLLSEGATVSSKPQLEILADDVKCTHGATIGHLDEDALFYLRARGLDSDVARSLLVHAFASELIDRVSLPELRRHLVSAIHALLPAGDLRGLVQ